MVRFLLYQESGSSLINVREGASSSGQDDKDKADWGGRAEKGKEETESPGAIIEEVKKKTGELRDEVLARYEILGLTPGDGKVESWRKSLRALSDGDDWDFGFTPTPEDKQEIKEFRTGLKALGVRGNGDQNTLGNIIIEIVKQIRNNGDIPLTLEQWEQKIDNNELGITTDSNGLLRKKDSRYLLRLGQQFSVVDKGKATEKYPWLSMVWGQFKDASSRGELDMGVKEGVSQFRQDNTRYVDQMTPEVKEVRKGAVDLALATMSNKPKETVEKYTKLANAGDYARLSGDLHQKIKAGVDYAYQQRLRDPVNASSSDAQKKAKYDELMKQQSQGKNVQKHRESIIATYTDPRYSTPPLDRATIIELYGATYETPTLTPSLEKQLVLAAALGKDADDLRNRMSLFQDSRIQTYMSSGDVDSTFRFLALSAADDDNNGVADHRDGNTVSGPAIVQKFKEAIPVVMGEKGLSKQDATKEVMLNFLEAIGRYAYKEGLEDIRYVLRNEICRNGGKRDLNLANLQKLLTTNHAAVLLMQKYVHDKPGELNPVLRYGDGRFDENNKLLQNPEEIVLENELNEDLDALLAKHKNLIDAAVKRALESNPNKVNMTKDQVLRLEEAVRAHIITAALENKYYFEPNGKLVVKGMEQEVDENGNLVDKEEMTLKNRRNVYGIGTGGSINLWKKGIDGMAEQIQSLTFDRGASVWNTDSGTITFGPTFLQQKNGLYRGVRAGGSATFSLTQGVNLGAYLSAFVGKERQLNPKATNSLGDKASRYARVGMDVSPYGISFGAGYRQDKLDAIYGQFANLKNALDKQVGGIIDEIVREKQPLSLASRRNVMNNIKNKFPQYAQEQEQLTALVDNMIHLFNHFDFDKVQDSPSKKAMMVSLIKEELSLGWMHDKMQMVDGKWYFGGVSIGASFTRGSFPGFLKSLGEFVGKAASLPVTVLSAAVSFKRHKGVIKVHDAGHQDKIRGGLDRGVGNEKLPFLYKTIEEKVAFLNDMLAVKFEDWNPPSSRKNTQYLDSNNKLRPEHKITIKKEFDTSHVEHTRILIPRSLVEADAMNLVLSHKIAGKGFIKLSDAENTSAGDAVWTHFSIPASLPIRFSSFIRNDQGGYVMNIGDEVTNRSQDDMLYGTVTAQDGWKKRFVGDNLPGPEMKRELITPACLSEAIRKLKAKRGMYGLPLDQNDVVVDHINKIIKVKFTGIPVPGQTPGLDANGYVTRKTNEKITFKKDTNGRFSRTVDKLGANETMSINYGYKKTETFMYNLHPDSITKAKKSIETCLASDPSIFANLFKQHVNELKAFTNALDQANVSNPSSLTNAYDKLLQLLGKNSFFQTVKTEIEAMKNHGYDSRTSTRTKEKERAEYIALRNEVLTPVSHEVRYVGNGSYAFGLQPDVILTKRDAVFNDRLLKEGHGISSSSLSTLRQIRQDVASRMQGKTTYQAQTNENSFGFTVGYNNLQDKEYGQHRLAEKTLVNPTLADGEKSGPITDPALRTYMVTEMTSKNTALTNHIVDMITQATGVSGTIDIADIRNLLLGKSNDIQIIQADGTSKTISFTEVHRNLKLGFCARCFNETFLMEDLKLTLEKDDKETVQGVDVGGALTINLMETKASSRMAQTQSISVAGAGASSVGQYSEGQNSQSGGNSGKNNNQGGNGQGRNNSQGGNRGTGNSGQG